MSSEHEPDFKLLAEHSADILCRVGLDETLQYASPSITRILGWHPSEVVGHGPDQLVLPEDLHLIKEGARRTKSSPEVAPPVTVRVRRKDGTVTWLECNAQLVLDPDSQQPREVVLIMRDVAARQQLEQQLLALALTDGLTGLSNRRAFDEVLERTWHLTLRDGTQASLILLDLDHFKAFNDTYGHQVGDDCLRAVAAAVRGAVRRTDLVARYGGEEIAIILPTTLAPEAVRVAGNIRGAIHDLRIPHALNPNGNGLVSVSIGVATALARLGGTIRMPESLLMAADNALYKAKHHGRNRISSTLLMAPHQRSA